jgi:hypothetical protein
MAEAEDVGVPQERLLEHVARAQLLEERVVLVDVCVEVAPHQRVGGERIRKPSRRAAVNGVRTHCYGGPQQRVVGVRGVERARPLAQVRADDRVRLVDPLVSPERIRIGEAEDGVFLAVVADQERD